KSIQAFILDVWQEDHGGWATIISVALLLFGATTVFGELKSALNTICGVVIRPGRPFLTMVRDRILSFSMVLVIGFLLMTSLLVSTTLTIATKYFSRWVPVHPDLLAWCDVGISLVVISVLFALILKLLPNVHVNWGDVWLGAIVTAGLFTIGKAAIGLYLSTSTVASSFGAAGSVVVVLLWVYYSSCILFFGAEFTKCYTRKYGSGVRPNSRAMLLTEAILKQVAEEQKIANRIKPRPDTDKAQSEDKTPARRA
ncbi:MAG: YihY/virulence factor BrkB family protein, partial [Verrucomicrobium sp.]